MSMTQSSSEYFEQVAGQWDNIRAGYFTEAIREAAIAKAYLRPEMVVADVGAGTGFVTAGLAPLVHKVHVLDGSTAMLAVARNNLAQFQNIEYHVSDAESLQLADGSVDAAFANMYLHHCVDPLAAIREMTRILKPGGRLIITDMEAHPYTWLKEELTDVWQGFEQSQLHQWFTQAGLVNLIIGPSGLSCSAESQDPKFTDPQGRLVSISVFLAVGTCRMDGVRESVQEHYSGLAKSGCGCGGTNAQSDGACCSGSGSEGSTCCQKSEVDNIFVEGYSKDQLSQVPGEASDLVLGCGNPTAMAGLKAGEVALDIGSGGGLDSFLAAQKVGPQGKVIGVDMTPAMLERARAAARRGGYQNVEFRQGQAEALPVEDQSVDVILSNCVINLCEDKGKVFAEAYRALKPGGRIEVSDMVSSSALPLAARYNATGWAECVGGALPEKEYLDLVAQAGFTSIQTRCSTSAVVVEGVSVYSLEVSAVKTEKAGCCEGAAKGSSCCG
jgi:ubiquinone/menaquinone biosynthesis C-methylase UbiE